MARFFCLSPNSTEDHCKAIEAAVGSMPEFVQTENQHTWAHLLRALQERDAIALIADSSGVCAGFCKAHYSDAKACAVIDILHVMPHFRNKGLGRTLLIRIENLWAARGVTTIVFPVAAEQACTQLAAIAGYTIRATETVSLSNVKLAATRAVVFIKTLSAAAGEM